MICEQYLIIKSSIWLCHQNGMTHSFSLAKKTRPIALVFGERLGEFGLLIFLPRSSGYIQYPAAVIMVVGQKYGLCNAQNTMDFGITGYQTINIAVKYFCQFQCLFFLRYCFCTFPCFFSLTYLLIHFIIYAVKCRVGLVSI